MLTKDEKRILLSIKVLPVLIIIILSAVVTYLFTVQNQDRYEKEITTIKEEFVKTNKLKIKLQVKKMAQIIENEKKDALAHLKRHVKNEVQNAYSVAINLYKKNQHLSQEEIKKLILNALRDVRYDKGKGYVFIYTLEGVNVLHPINPELEGKDLWNYRDKKDVKIIQRIVPILKEKKESYDQWWWTKPNSKKEYKKIGYHKIFEPFGWFIGSGLYVDDYEENLKHTLLHYLKNISTQEDGYLFILNTQGKVLTNNYTDNLQNNEKINPIKKTDSHLEDKELKHDHNEEQITHSKETAKESKNQTKIKRTVLKDQTIQHILNFAKKGNGFTTYDVIKKDATTSTQKISYVKNIKEYDWIIGYGFHPEDVEKTIKIKEQALKKENKSIIVRMFFINVVVTIMLIVILILFSDFVKKRFVIYRNENLDYQKQLHSLIDEKTIKLEKLNKTLEDKVQEEVTKNREKDKILFQQSKMAAMGELLAMIAHQWRQPLAQINSTTLNMYSNYKKGEFSLETLKKDIVEIENTTNFLSQTITDFSTFFSPEKEKIVFSTQQAVTECLHILFPKFIHKVNVIIDIKNDVKIDGHMNQYQQAVLTILINALDMFEERHIDFPTINIVIDEQQGKSKLSISDNAQGIHKDSLDKIFEAYYSTKKSKKNSGLGLHISKMIVEQNMNGELSVENIEDGAKFTVII